MPTSTGFNHVATVTADLDGVVAFYRAVFDAQVTFEMAATGDHPRMAILDLAALDEVRDRLIAGGADIGDIQRLGDSWSLFFRDPDGMELEVCTPA
jgi:catechol 2,3-dioxygenase-like lactoylglutathione lyase family enzyme